MAREAGRFKILLKLLLGSSVHSLHTKTLNNFQDKYSGEQWADQKRIKLRI